MSVNHPIFERNWPSDLWSEDATLSLHTTHSTSPAAWLASTLVCWLCRARRSDGQTPAAGCLHCELALGLMMCGWRGARVLLLVASALIELSRCLEALQPSPSQEGRSRLDALPLPVSLHCFRLPSGWLLCEASHGV